MHIHNLYIAELTLNAEDWLVILAIHAVVIGAAIAGLVKMVEKLTEAKLERAKELQKREDSWQRTCNQQLGCLADLVAALSRQGAYLTALIRFVIQECQKTEQFPRIAHENRNMQEGVDKAAAELELFSLNPAQRHAAAQSLAHQFGDWRSHECIAAARQLYPDDLELKHCLAVLYHRLQSPFVAV